MNKRLFAMVCTLLLLCGGASAEFYTANPDRYYHASADCIAGSTYEISETAARQFEKLACPVCVDHISRMGEVVEIPLPENNDFCIYGTDLRDGKLLLCGYESTEESTVPFLKLFDMHGEETASLEGQEGCYVRDACILSDGRVVLILGNLDRVMKSIMLVEDMKEISLLGYGVNPRFIEAEGDGWIICGDFDGEKTWRMVQFDSTGKQLWQTEEFPESNHAAALFAQEDGCIVLGHEDVHREFSMAQIAAVDGSGNIAGGTEVQREFWKRINSNLHLLQGDVRVNGEMIFCICDYNFLPWKEGWLAALPTNGPYVRLVYIDGTGKIEKDWFEDMGRISYHHRLWLMRDGGDAYLLSWGTTPEQKTRSDSDGIYYYKEQQAILKKLEVNV